MAATLRRLATILTWRHLALVFAGLLQISTASAQSGVTPFVNWINSLPAAYNVQQGAASQFQFSDCQNLYNPYFGSCFGNNPATPYIVLHPPKEVVSGNNLPPYMNAFQTADGNSNTFYQIGPNEAIVTIIALPPQAAYWSFQSYMFSRPISSYGVSPNPTPRQGQTQCQGKYPSGSKSLVTPDCTSYQVFGYFDNAINDVLIQQQSGLQFSNNGSQAIAVITTPNKTLFNKLRAQFVSGGPNNNQNEIFFEHIPTDAGPPAVPPADSSLVIGVDNQFEDVFASIIRYAVAADSVAGNAWSSNAASNVLVYRVGYPGLAATNLPANAINAQTCNSNESAVITPPPPQNCQTPPAPPTSTYFDNDIQQIIKLLAQYVQTHMSMFTYVSAEFPFQDGESSKLGSPAGPRCIFSANPCVGSTADNNAYRTIAIGLLQTDAPAFVVGVYHSASTEVTTTNPVNNATYTSVGASDQTDNAGATDVSQANIGAVGFTSSAPQRLSGSAALVLNTLGILPTGPQYTNLLNDLPNLYITVFERTPSGNNYCPGNFCPSNSYINQVLVAQGGNPTVGFVPSTNPVTLTERGYLLPSANASPPYPDYLTGANATYLQSPYVLYAKPAGSSAAVRHITDGLHR